MVMTYALHDPTKYPDDLPVYMKLTLSRVLKKKKKKENSGRKQ